MDPLVNPRKSTKKLTFDEIVKENDTLYSRVLKEGPDLVAHGDKEGSDLIAQNIKDSKLKILVYQVDSLLENLQGFSRLTRSWNEYQWLTDSIFRWQVLFASTLNIPKEIHLPTPQSNLLPPLLDSKALTEKEIDFLVRRNAKYLEKISQARNSSLTDFGINKSQSAEIFLASDILEGKINLAGRISSASYWRLEKVWVQDIKKLSAYFLWESRGREIDQDLEKADFIKASDDTRKLLINEGIKAQKSEFGEAKTYLEERFLSLEDGSLDSESNVVKSLISLKAQKIQEETGCADFDRNWKASKFYVDLFYRNIISAVINKDSEDGVLAVLKAFQYSQHGNDGKPYHIINAFEAALIIYFVDKLTILSLWKKSVKHPEPISLFKSTVKLQYFKDDFIVPSNLENKFNWLEGAISFEGIMTSTEFEYILQGLSNIKYRQAITKLFEQSRLIHEKTTL
jgi:hypothetical protein